MTIVMGKGRGSLGQRKLYNQTPTQSSIAKLTPILFTFVNTIMTNVQGTRKQYNGL